MDPELYFLGSLHQLQFSTTLGISRTPGLRERINWLAMPSSIWCPRKVTFGSDILSCSSTGPLSDLLKHRPKGSPIEAMKQRQPTQNSLLMTTFGSTHIVGITEQVATGCFSSKASAVWLLSCVTAQESIKAHQLETCLLAQCEMFFQTSVQALKLNMLQLHLWKDEQTHHYSN